MIAGDFAGDTNRPHNLVGDFSVSGGFHGRNFYNGDITAQGGGSEGGGGGTSGYLYSNYFYGVRIGKWRDTTLYIKGGAPKSAPLYTSGSVKVNNATTLFEWGKIPVSRSAPLFIWGRTSGNRNVPLFMRSALPANRSATLYVRAKVPTSRNATLFVWGKSPASRSAPLYLLNKLPANRNTKLFVWGKAPGSRTAPLFVDGGGTVNRNAPLFTKAVLAGARGATLYIPGNEAGKTSLYIMGALLKNRNATLYARGIQTLAAPLSIHGMVRVNRSAPLYVVSVYKGHKGLNLFTKAAPGTRVARSAPLSVWASTPGTSGKRRGAPLVTNCIAGQGNLGTRRLNLFVLAAATARCVRNLNLFVQGYAFRAANATPLYVESDLTPQAGQQCFVLENSGTTELLLEDNIHCLQADSQSVCSAPLFISGLSVFGTHKNLNLFLKHRPSAAATLFLQAPATPKNRAAALVVRGGFLANKNAPLALPATRSTASKNATLLVRGY